MEIHDDFSMAVLANAKAGGDNCHRGVVIGPLLYVDGYPRGLATKIANDGKPVGYPGSTES